MANSLQRQPSLSEQRRERMKFQLANLNPLSTLARQATNILRSWKTQFRDRFRGETAATYFDISKSAEVNAELAAHGVAPLEIDSRDAERDPAGAARFILANLVCNPAVRRHYPTALNDGLESSFVDYLCDTLRPEAVANVLSCFANPPGEPTKRVLE